MVMKTVSIVLLVVFTTAGVCAQEFKQLTKSMRDQYQSWKTMHIVMNITIYDSAQTESFFTQQVEIQRDGNKYFYKLGENQMLMNEDCLITVDEDSKQILYSARSIAAESEMFGSMKFNIDSILNSFVSPRFVDETEGVQHYVMDIRNDDITTVHYYILPEKLLLKRLEYQYPHGQRAVIDFQLFEHDIKFKGDVFSASRFVIKSQKKLVPARLFYNFQLVDLTAKK
jgi:hypothetical protein